MTSLNQITDVKLFHLVLGRSRVLRILEVLAHLRRHRTCMICQKFAATRVIRRESSHIVDFSIDTDPAVFWSVMLGNLSGCYLSGLVSCFRHIVVESSNGLFIIYNN